MSVSFVFLLEPCLFSGKEPYSLLPICEVEHCCQHSWGRWRTRLWGPHLSVRLVITSCWREPVSRAQGLSASCSPEAGEGTWSRTAAYRLSAGFLFLSHTSLHPPSLPHFFTSHTSLIYKSVSRATGNCALHICLSFISCCILIFTTLVICNFNCYRAWSL